ncbi:hypothetical protein Hanom_Chr09g00769241 [Helianthus anomalus]
MYAGEWFKGQCHGCGIHTCEDGIKHGLDHYPFISLLRAYNPSMESEMSRKVAVGGAS